MKQIQDILKISKGKIEEEMNKLRKSQFVLMSPQRIEEKIVKIYEILPEGIEEIDKTETKGFDDTDFSVVKPVEILSIIDNVIKEIQDTQLEQAKKDSINDKLVKLKNKLEI